MKVKVVRINKGVTLNLGNFNSLRYDATLEAEVEEGEDHTEVAIELGKQIDALIDYETSESGSK